MKGNRDYWKIFRALGDEHRLHILDMLMEREMNAGEILAAMDIVQSTLSHHMKTLVTSGLVIARRDGKCMCYTVDPEAVRNAQNFLNCYLDPDHAAEATETAAVSAAPKKTTARKPAGRRPAAGTAKPARAAAPVRKAAAAKPAKQEEVEKEEPKKEAVKITEPKQETVKKETSKKASSKKVSDAAAPEKKKKDKKKDKDKDKDKKKDKKKKNSKK